MTGAPELKEQRRILLLAHTGREESCAIAHDIGSALVEHGLRVRVLASEGRDMDLIGNRDVEIADESDPAADCELAVVLGGDGTILRAAELVHQTGTPILGMNLGHVGFLAEADTGQVDAVIAAIVNRNYLSEDRLTIDVQVFQGKDLVAATWALNEASIEKAARQRMLELVIGIDGRPISRFGCDGIVCATPTGSTAYNFSAGGPIVWPEVEAMLMVPISAHALFARPMVVSPASVLAIEVLSETEGTGVLWCDGRRTVDLAPGARIEVRRGATPVRLVRLHAEPFSDRLVNKFELPVSGWRGSRRGSSG